MQRLLSRAVWDADAVRDDVRAVVVARFGDPDAVAVVDETVDLKKSVLHDVVAQVRVAAESMTAQERVQLERIVTELLRSAELLS